MKTQLPRSLRRGTWASLAVCALSALAPRLSAQPPAAPTPAAAAAPKAATAKATPKAAPTAPPPAGAKAAAKVAATAQPASATKAAATPQPAGATKAAATPQPASATKAAATPQPASATKAAATPQQPAAAAKPKPAAVRDESLAIGREKLERPDEQSVRQGLEILAGVGGEAATTAVVARLKKGLPPQLTEASIDTLVLLGRPTAAPALLELTSHFRAPIRQRAVSALGALGIKSAQSALLFALDDPSPEVRAAAVAALGTVGTSRALPALFVAFDRQVEGSLAAIAQIATPADVKAIVAHAQDGDVSAIKPALNAMMVRKTFPQDGKLRLVREVSSLGSPSAKSCVTEWLEEALKAEGAPPLRRALLDAVKRLDAEEKKKDVSKTQAGAVRTEKAS